MTPRLALSIAPILMFALSNPAQAQVTEYKTGHNTYHQMSRLASTRHGRPRMALLSRRHNRQISFRHLAIRHVDGRHVVPSGDGDSYGVSETDGWNAALAGISSRPAGAPIGASIRWASFEVPISSASPAIGSQTGVASYYGGQHNGRRTSSGLIFNEHDMTAAHATLPFGTKVLVKLAGSDRSVVVTITDRLCERHRIIDLSEGAAEQLGIVREGLAMVMLTPQN